MAKDRLQDKQQIVFMDLSYRSERGNAMDPALHVVSGEAVLDVL